MSYAQKIEISCPVCDEDYSPTVWWSVNTSLSPALKEQLLDGSLNEVTCPACGEVTPIFGPLLYHDTDKGLMFYVPEARGAMARRRPELHARDFVRNCGAEEDIRIRVVDSLAELRHTIRTIETAEDADGTPLEAATAEEWHEIIDLITKPPLPWPLDHTCVCGEKIQIACLCEEPGIPIDMSAYEPDVPPDLQIDCDRCGRTLVAFSCKQCGQSYHWSMGTLNKIPRAVKN